MPKAAKSKDGNVPIRWEDDVAEHDYAAAHAYLSLKLTAAATGKVVTRLRKTKLTTRRANDILRASGLTPAPLDDPGVIKDLIKVIEGKPLSPILVVVGAAGTEIGGGGGTRLAQHAWLSVFRFLKMRPWFGQSLYLDRAQERFDEQNRLTDEATREQLLAVVTGFAAHCVRLPRSRPS